MTSLPHPASFFRKAETVTHACNALTAWWDCIMEEDSNPPAIPWLTSLQCFCLLHLLSASFSGSFICSLPLAQPCVLRNHLCTTHCSSCVRCVFMQAHRLAFPLHGPFKFLLWQTDLLKRVIHRAWSRLSPTSLRAGTDKSAGLPNQTLLQGLVLCHVLTSHFGLHVLDVFYNGRPFKHCQIWCKFSQKYGQSLHADVTALFQTLNLAICVKTFCERRRKEQDSWLV